MAKPSRAADQKRLAEELAERASAKPPAPPAKPPRKRRSRAKPKPEPEPQPAPPTEPTVDATPEFDAWELVRELYPDEIRGRVDKVRGVLSKQALIAVELAECLTLKAAMKSLRPGKTYAAMANTYLQSRKQLARLIGDKGPGVNGVEVPLTEFLRRLFSGEPSAPRVIDIGDDVMATPDPAELPERYR